MIKNKKIVAVILCLAVAYSGTYSTYSYFTSQSIHSENKISIGELEPEEGLQELVEAKIQDNTLELKFSKRLFNSTKNVSDGVSGDEKFLENTEISIEGNSLFIKKVSGEWTIPKKKNEKDLPKVSIENFEDRFGNKIKSQDIYLYKSNDFDSIGKLEYIIANKNSSTDADIIASTADGTNMIPGTNASTELSFKNSEEDVIDMSITTESKIGSEEVVNDKKIKILATYGTEAYSEWVGDTLEIYLCYDSEYSEMDIQRIIDEVVSVDANKLRMHEFGITKINVKFKDNTKVLKPTIETEYAEGIFNNAKNSILGKNTRGSISVKSKANTTGRFKVKISDNQGVIAEEIFLAIQEESPKDIMAKITPAILNKFDTSKYMITLKDGNTRFDITSRSTIDTGLNVEIEKM